MEEIYTFISCSALGGIRSSSHPEKILADMTRTLVYIKEIGFEHVELWYSDLPTWIGNKIQEVLANLSLNPFSIHLPKFLVTFNDSKFNKVVCSCFSFIKSNGIKVAVLHPPAQEKLSSQEWRDRLQVLLHEAQEAECVLTFENVPYIKGIDQYILEEIERQDSRFLGVTIDMEFMHLNSSKMQSLETIFKEHLSNIHFRDSNGGLLGEDGRRNYIVPGDGEIDLCNAVNILHRSGYKGPLTIEVSHRQRENIIRAKQYAEDCLKKL